MAFHLAKAEEVRLHSCMESTASPQSTESSTPTPPSSEGTRPCDRGLPAEGELTRWKRGAMFAGGSYGCIYRAFDVAARRIFATKVYCMEEDLAEDTARKARISKRLAELDELRHPNIIEHLGHEFVDRSLCIYLEYVAGGTLASVLEEFGPVCKAVLKAAAAGLMGGLEYLHSREPAMVHGDVNSSNILVGDNWCLKLQCFQCSRHIARRQDFASMESLGYMAPEVFQGKDADSTKTDIWGAGCVILEMATAERPWAGVPLDEVLLALGGSPPSSPRLPAGLPPAVRDCAAACLRPDASSRPSAAELLRMPLLLEAKLPPFGGIRAS